MLVNSDSTPQEISQEIAKSMSALFHNSGNFSVSVMVYPVFASGFK